MKATLFIGATVVVLGASATAAAEIDLTPSTNFQAVVDGAPEKTTFRFSPGIYRNFSVQPKNGDVFQGASGVSLNGATVLTLRQSRPGLWVADAASLLPENVSGAPCDAALKNADGSQYTVGCTHERSLYRNNVPLWRVATLQEVGPGKWYFDDSAKQAYVRDDPAGAVIELGTMRDAFHGKAQNVSISSLTIEKYAGPQQHGAIDCESGSGWTISGNTIRLNHSRGVGFNCDATRITGNRITMNGNLGIGGCCAKDVLIEGNEIDSNNYVHFSSGWEAGGVKTARTTALVARQNNVHGNDGFGLWSDIDALFTIYDGNTVVNNSYGGIFYEISHGAWIMHNVAGRNGEATKGKDPWLWFAQISVSTSDHVVVESNTVSVADFGNGITIVDQNRGSDDLGALAARDNLVVGNKITYESKMGASGAGSDRDKVFENNNIFEDNVFLGVNPQAHYYWNGSLAPWAPDFKGK